MLKKIEFIFPKNDKNIELFNCFSILFKNLSYVNFTVNQEIHIISSNLNPKTIFKLDDTIADIQFNIGNAQYLDLLNKHSSHIKKSTSIKELTIKNVASKLSGHIIGIDHTGINLPKTLYTKDEYNSLLDYLSSISNVYSYPTGEPWPFVIPATIKENQEEITNFNLLRKPMFEFIHDSYTDTTTLQIQLETDFTKSEVEKLFPKNEGVYFTGLEEVYKAIYLNYSPHFNIRLDITFNESYEDYDTRRWFVCEGKRL